MHINAAEIISMHIAVVRCQQRFFRAHTNNEFYPFIYFFNKMS